MKQADIAFVDVHGRPIAHRLRPGSAPTLVFLPGYASDMDGSKADEIDEFAGRRRLGCLRFDYSGTGSSPGDFATGTLTRWIEDTLGVIDELTSGALLLVGSSMGAWIALHVALQRSARVVGMVGISAAPDFTDWGFGADDKAAIVRDGFLGPETHRVHRTFWDSGQSLLLLHSAIPIDCPVRLLHGEQDAEVPFDIALRLLGALRSADVQLSLIKGGGHRLSEPREIQAILCAVANLLEP